MKVHSPFNRLWAKVSLLLVAVTLVPVGLLGHWSISFQSDLVESQIRAMNRSFSQLISYQVYSLLRHSRRSIDAMASNPDLANQDPALIQNVLDEFLVENPLFEGITLFDRGRRARVHSGRDFEPPEPRRLFTNALFDRYGGTSSTIPGHIRIMRPLRDGKQRLTGALVAALDGKIFAATLQRILTMLTQAYEDLHIYVLDQDSRCIASTREAPFLEGNLFAYWSQDPRVENRVTYPIKSFYAYETPPWEIVIIPKASARVSLLEMRETLEWVALGTALIALAFGVIFGRHVLTHPLAQLVRSAQTISRGDLSHPVPVPGHDEIGELAESFETMRRSVKSYQGELRDKISQLKTLYDVGRAISSTLEQDELLELVVDLVMRIAQADRASLMLLDEETEELTIAVAKGLPKDVLEKTRVRLGEGVAGTVLANRRPLLVLDTMKSPTISKLKGGQVLPGTMLSVPLIAKDKPLGVLNLSKSVPNTIDERELNLFEGIANQAAVAIHNARLYTLAITDELTKLYIRRYFYQRLRDEMNRAWKRGLPLTVIITDIDHFKNFNDTYGHPQGDQVLIHVARMMKQCMRRIDIVCRLGGEEFVILCPQQTVEEVMIPAERIRSTLEKTSIDLGGVAVNVTLSLGVAGFPDHAETPDDLVERADQALYLAKKTGRNRICRYDEVPVSS